MGAFEYLLIFAAVILGLAVSDLAISTHRLFNAARAVRWDWLAPLAAVFAFVRIVTQWWTWYAAETIAKGLTFGMFVGVLVSATLLFLMAAAALPDEITPERVDLRAYYMGVARRYWLLFGAQWLLMNAISIWAQVRVLGLQVDLMSPDYLIVVAALILAFWRNRWAHTVGLIGFIALYTSVYFSRTLA